MSIRRRLTLFNALAIGLILLALGLALVFLLQNALFRDLEDTVRSRATAAARTVESGDSIGRDEAVQITLDGVFVNVRDGEGRILTQTVSLPTGGEDGEGLWRRALQTGEPVGAVVDHYRIGGDEEFLYAVPVDPPSGPARVVEAGKSYENAGETMNTLVAVLAAGIGAAFLLSLAGAYLLARAALRPVGAAVSAAAEITESDLGRRLPVANPKDEIGLLGTTFNGLLARLEAAFARREETLDRQRRFAADASHELRTPLTSIRGYTRMLQGWALDDPETARESVAAIDRESARMQDLVEGLLALTRGDEGPPLDVGRHDLAEVAEEAVQTARAAAGGKVSVGYVPPGGPVEATFDRESVRQAASIVLDNAVKYTPEGGKVMVAVRERDGAVELEVHDNGAGIPQDQLPLIFERFHRADPSRTEGGAGLGLSIARQIAEAHGGAMEAESRPGRGSTFTLSLPQEPMGPPIRTGSGGEDGGSS